MSSRDGTNGFVVNGIDGDDQSGISVAGVGDVNNDGILDLGDINAFVNAFISGDIAADTNADGVTDFGDIQAFVAAFLAGC